jgi:hypothetical protein
MQAPRLIDLRRSHAWLAQFEPDDRQVASELLGSLHLISASRFQTRIIELLDSVIPQSEHCGAFAAREVPGGQLFANRKQKPAFDAHDIGSEGTIRHLLTTVRRRSRGFLVEPSISSIRRYRVHEILVIDDAVLSGSRIFSFLRAFRAHPTTKSWLSLGRFRFRIVSFVAHDSGVAHARDSLAFCHSKKRRPVPMSFHVATVAGRLAGHEPFARLLAKYGPRARTRVAFDFGFGNTSSDIIFSHKCPNNAPSILWSGTKAWSPLFPGGSVPPDLLPAFGDDHVPAQFTSQLHLGRVLGFLILVSHGLRNERRILERRRLDGPEIAMHATQAIGLGLMTPQWRLTEAGRREVTVALRTRKSVPAPNEAFYFPTFMRRPGG